MSKAKFSLDLSEAQWELYPAQANDVDSHHEFEVDLPYGPWVEFTYNGLRDPAQKEIWAGMAFGSDELIHCDDRVFSDVVIEFLPDEEILYLVTWTGGYEDPGFGIKKTLEEAEELGRQWRDFISGKELDEVRVLKFNLTTGTQETIVNYWYNTDHNGVVETRK